MRWVSENLRLFDVVNNRGFQSLMKTGRPAYYLPNLRTVACDVKLVYSQTKERIASMLQVRIYNNTQTDHSNLLEI